jgi:hypothetical protein
MSTAAMVSACDFHLCGYKVRLLQYAVASLQFLDFGILASTWASRNSPYWISRENSLELIELSSINIVGSGFLL